MDYEWPPEWEPEYRQVLADTVVSVFPVTIVSFHFRASSTAGGFEVHDGQTATADTLIATFVSQFGHPGSVVFPFDRGWPLERGLRIVPVATFVELGIWFYEFPGGRTVRLKPQPAP